MNNPDESLVDENTKNNQPTGQTQADFLEIEEVIKNFIHRALDIEECATQHISAAAWTSPAFVDTP